MILLFGHSTLVMLTQPWSRFENLKKSQFRDRINFPEKEILLLDERLALRRSFQVYVSSAHLFLPIYLRAIITQNFLENYVTHSTQSVKDYIHSAHGTFFVHSRNLSFLWRAQWKYVELRFWKEWRSNKTVDSRSIDRGYFEAHQKPIKPVTYSTVSNSEMNYGSQANISIASISQCNLPTD